jgi:hypothetical protein
MSARQRLTNDSYIVELKNRSKLAFEWFNAIALALRTDLEEFKNQETTSSNPSLALETLDLQLIGDAPITEVAGHDSGPAELTLSTKFSKVRLIANDPPGWICLEVSKRSPLFNGVLHRGAIEIVLIPHGTAHDEVHFVECDWLNADSSVFPKSGEAIADKLWEILLLPKIRHQLAAAQKGASR